MPGKKKILIIDDEEVVASSLKKMLEISGFEAQYSRYPKNIISMVKSFGPDLILLDLVMPEIGGFEVCQMLNEDNDTKSIPIIIISALSDYADKKKAFKLGVVGYLTKPYELEDVMKEVNKAISSKDSSE